MAEVRAAGSARTLYSGEMGPLLRLLSTWPGRIAVGFLVCTLAGVYFGTQLHLSTKAWGPAAPLEWSITVRLWAWYQWGLLLPLILWLGARFRLPRSSSFALHLLFSLVFAAAQIALNTWTHLTFVEPEDHGHSYTGYFRSLMMFAFHRNVLIYWAAILGQAAWRAVRELHQQRVAAAELRTQLTEARLDALQLQLHPHFLFNTLNAIAALVRRDPDTAEGVVHDLSELLRLTLDDVESPLVPLAREVDVVERYLAIQRVRFGDRLRVDLDIDPAALSATVPPMMLQTLLENSIRHGMGSRYRGGRIWVRARRAGDRLELVVEDDGPGLSVPPEEALGKGIGLSNTVERLHRTFEGDYGFSIDDRPAGGVIVRIDVPAVAPEFGVEPESASGPARDAAADSAASSAGGALGDAAARPDDRRSPRWQEDFG